MTHSSVAKTEDMNKPENNIEIVDTNSNTFNSTDVNNVQMIPVGYDVSAKNDIIYYYEVEKVMHTEEPSGRIRDHSEIVTYFSSHEENTNKSRNSIIGSYAQNDQFKRTNDDPVTFKPSKPSSKTFGGKAIGYITIGNVKQTNKTESIPPPLGNGDVGSINGRFKIAPQSFPTA